MKTCTRCETNKPKSDFNKKTSRPDGLYNFCRLCQKEENQLTYHKHKEVRLAKVAEYYEVNKEAISKKNAEISDERKVKAKQWRENNKEYVKEYFNNYLLENKEERKNIRRKSNAKNKDKINEARRKWTKSSPTAKVAKSCRARLHETLQNKSYPKTKKFAEILGCTHEQLVAHLEAQFLPGMSWDNHGYDGWHIDHIKALANATTEQEVYELCHYTNLQPLWALDNLKKNKY